MQCTVVLKSGPVAGGWFPSEGDGVDDPGLVVAGLCERLVHHVLLRLGRRQVLTPGRRLPEVKRTTWVMWAY